MIPNSQWVESSDLEPEMQESTPARYHDAWRAVVGADGILVPGGFGQRGSEGMMLAIKYARESKIPFLGICLGFQLAVVEWARNVLDLPGAMSGMSRVSDRDLTTQDSIARKEQGGLATEAN